MVFLQLKEFQNVTLGITTARLTYRYQSEREGNVFNYERARMPEHKFIDLSITYKPNDKDWYFSLYGKNLSDEVTVGTWAASTDPRTYGVMFGTSF